MNVAKAALYACWGPIFKKIHIGGPSTDFRTSVQGGSPERDGGRTDGNPRV